MYPNPTFVAFNPFNCVGCHPFESIFHIQSLVDDFNDCLASRKFTCPGFLIDCDCEDLFLLVDLKTCCIMGFSDKAFSIPIQCCI